MRWLEEIRSLFINLVLPTFQNPRKLTESVGKYGEGFCAVGMEGEGGEGRAGGGGGENRKEWINKEKWGGEGGFEGCRPSHRGHFPFNRILKLAFHWLFINGSDSSTS